MYKIGKDFILKLHDDNIEKYGGDYGFIDEGTFEMLCSQPYQNVFGMELYPTIYDKAAKFVEGFATHQVFRDGNKRTGFAAMNMFLNFNGLELTMTEKEAEEFVLAIANKEIPSYEEVSKILQEKTQEYDVKQIEMIEDFMILD